MTTQVHHPNENGEAGSDDSEVSDDDTSEEPDGQVLHRANPSTRLVVIRFVAYLVAGIAAIGVLLSNPELLGSREMTNIGLLITQLVVAIALVRQVIAFVRLRHTEYVVTSKMMAKTYQLLGRSKTRQVPFERVRSHELQQGRIESQIGLGTITLNQGLGGLRLVNVPDPFEVYDHVREQTEL